MKTFRFQHVDGSSTIDFSTITVGELKAVISRFPDNAPVLATWEGIYAPIRDDADHIEFANPYHSCWHPDDIEPCLILDVNDH